MPIDERQARALLDKQAITDVLARFARGVDRFDWELARSCFHGGAKLEHGAFNGPVERFVPWLQAALAPTSLGMHTITNVLIDLDGDRAQSEAQVTAYQRAVTESGEDEDGVAGVRWIDRLERRAGEWKIAQRRTVWEWSTIAPVGRQWDFHGKYVTGRRDRQDAVYKRPAFRADWSPPDTLEGRLQEALDKQAIAEVAQRYCRAVDRLDRELARSCYHANATDDHGMYQGDRDGFIEYAFGGLPTMLGTMHYIGQVLVDVQGDVGYSEAYCVAYHRMPSRTSGRTEQVVGCRHLDRMERRDGEAWRIGDRVIVYDWSRVDPISGEYPIPPEWTRGQRSQQDPSYARAQQGERGA